MSQAVESSNDRGNSLAQVNRKLNNYVGSLPKENLDPSDLDPFVNLCQADIDPLIVNTSLDPDQTFFVDCMIDTGAGVSLLNEGVLPQLKDVKLKPSTEVKAIRGFGNQKKIVITSLLELPLRFDSGFTTKAIQLFIVPIEHMNHSVILGAVALKDNNLLPDLTRRELIHRRKNKFQTIAKDISFKIPFYNCIVPDFTVLPAHQCKMVPIEVPKIPNLQGNPIVEFQGVGHPQVMI